MLTHTYDDSARIAYRLADGIVEEISIGPDGYVVPEPIQIEDTGDAWQPVTLRARATDANLAFSLPLAIEAARKIAPFATWYFAPSAFEPAESWGRAWCTTEVAIVRTTLSPQALLSTTYHEAWHLVEELLSPRDLAIVDAALGNGPAWPGDYLPRIKERRARAFEHYAMMAVEGCRHTWGVGIRETDIFGDVFCGDFGRLVVESRLPAPPPKPRLLDRIAGLLPRAFPQRLAVAA